MASIATQYPPIETTAFFLFSSRETIISRITRFPINFYDTPPVRCESYTDRLVYNTNQAAFPLLKPFLNNDFQCTNLSIENVEVDFSLVTTLLIFYFFFTIAHI